MKKIEEIGMFDILFFEEKNIHIVDSHEGWLFEGSLEECKKWIEDFNKSVNPPLDISMN